MAFLNLDLYFIDTIVELLQAIKSDPDNREVEQLFADRPERERLEAKQYLYGLTITTDLRDRDERKHYLYVLDSFTIADLAFPQINVYLGGEEAQDFFLGSDTGADPVPVVKNNATVAWDREQGYLAGVHYRVDIVCNTKREAIWLSRLCQLAILKQLMALDVMGVKEPRVGLADIRLEQEHFPSIVYGRAVTFTAKAVNTWFERVPAAGPIDEGVNTFMNQGG